MYQQNEQHLINEMRSSLLDILRQIQNLDADSLDSIIVRLELLSSHVIRLCDINFVNAIIYKIAKLSQKTQFD